MSMADAVRQCPTVPLQNHVQDERGSERYQDNQLVTIWPHVSPCRLFAVCVQAEKHAPVEREKSSRSGTGRQFPSPEGVGEYTGP